MSDHSDSVYNTAWTSLRLYNSIYQPPSPAPAPARNAKKHSISTSTLSSVTATRPRCPLQREGLRNARHRLSFLICSEDNKSTGPQVVHVGTESACAHDGGQRRPSHCGRGSMSTTLISTLALQGPPKVPCRLRSPHFTDEETESQGG